MKRIVWTMSVLVVVFGVLTGASADVLLYEDFTGTSLDTSKWATLTFGESAPTEITINTDYDWLRITQVPGTSDYASTGIRSQSGFSVPEGQLLVVDYYGRNRDYYRSTYDSQQCWPWWGISASTPSDYFRDADDTHFVGLRGSSKYTDETFRYRADSSVDVTSIDMQAKLTYGDTNYMHVIFTVDANEINLYLADDYYDNLVDPTPLATVATSDVFTGAQLANDGLYVYAMVQNRIQSTATVDRFEDFNEITVSLIPVPEPATMTLLGLGSVALLLKR